MIAGNNTPSSGVVGLVPVFIVCLERPSGDLSSAPQPVIPARGCQPRNELGGSTIPALGTPPGAALRVSRRPRDRMGLCRPARQHARHQFERNVHRSARYAVGWRRLHCATASSSARQTQLPGETRRARPWYGRLRGPSRVRKPESLQRSSFIPRSPRRLKRLILNWTLCRETVCAHSVESLHSNTIAMGSRVGSTTRKDPRACWFERTHRATK